MSIVKMKRLRLAAMAADRDRLLRLLQQIGCVEITEPEVDEEDAPLLEALTRPDTGGFTAAREEQNQAERALEVLKRCAPAKSGFLTPKPELREADLFDEASAQSARARAEEKIGRAHV